ncbi:putative protein-tyrosine phosphatase [Helianthus annuus]|nr:putative protein-tyrosine phosphatase [Helianthus annuus]KAJ0594473.1 putative protein-tyrosine phosphatase [Helianthus annuus]KAJ0707697.1 putative protein-tyrosine phosphatase [Helianthus annuus]KAJ0711679.1 putative protein-tyrosine phosphatase [Helianthus annuus]
MESENLLDSLKVCLDFIDESRKTGSILVHCFAGVDHSSTLYRRFRLKVLGVFSCPIYAIY